MFNNNAESVLINIINKLINGNIYVSEITINQPGLLFYKEKGKRKSIELPEINTAETYNQAIEGLIKKAGLISRTYLVEGRYNISNDRFGRMHITMPPASSLPQLTLAIKTSMLDSLTSIQSTGTFNTDISMFLKAAIGSKLTIVIAGSTGAGKTTLLEALTTEFDYNERVGVCEDTPELLLKTPNTAYLTSTVWVPGMSAADVADLSWVVKQINRMRVDRIIVGETRGKEFFDFITAANSGAEGSLTTLHANDGHSAMKKMSTFMYMSVDMAPRIINEMISQAVDIVIQLGHNKQTGDHKILSIDEVTNAISSGESPTIALNPLFTYNHETNNWEKKFATDRLKRKLDTYGYNPNSYAIKKSIDTSETTTGLPNYFRKEND